MPASNSVYSSSFFELELDGNKDAVTSLRSIEGGGVKAEVINYQMGENGDVWRQLGKPKYDDIKITAGLSGSPDLWAWMSSFLKGTPERRNGAIVAGDANYKAKARREFFDALITEIAFPKWDGTDKNAANVNVTISPERITYAPGDGEIDVRAPDEARQRNVKACNFHFELDGFKEACARTAKVDAFSVKMKVIEHAFGTQLHASKVPGKFEWPNLVFYIPEVDAAPLRELHAKTVMKGERSPGRTATLTFYNNAKADQGSFTFSGVHVFNVAAEKHDAGSEDVKLTKVECAVERIEVRLSVQEG
ncbi:MAG TPA: phage tail protein [Kofleriaceae bacterium]|jgi:phage tail-like protein|nr:phage tail protein [Kofleriaceae bacterium]